MSGTEDEVVGTLAATPPPKVRHQPNTVDHAEPACFFKLPLELRTMIYKDVLTCSSAGPQLLRTCREIYNEAYAFLFERPLTFRGQSALYRWLDHTPAEHLRRVSEITLELHDADLRPLITSDADADADAVPEVSPSRLQAWDLYDAELATLRSSLAQLGRISHLTVRALSESRSFLYREFLGNFLTSLSSIWPHLRGLTLEGNFHHQNLSFISQLSGLKLISFDGFSSTPPAEMATLLGGLTQLERLALVSQYSLLTPTTHLHSAFTSKRQSFTKDVLLAVKHIASFAVTERVQSSAPALFFTPEMLETLHNHSALKSLAIRLSQKPDTETLEALDAFLCQSSIERLELDWPGFDPGDLETHSLLPDSLKWVWVRVSSEEVALDMLETVLARMEGGHLTYIRKVVLMKDEGFGTPWPHATVIPGLELKKRNDSAVTQYQSILYGEDNVASTYTAEAAHGTEEDQKGVDKEARPKPTEVAPEHPGTQAEPKYGSETDTAAEESSTQPPDISQDDTVPKPDTGTVSDKGGGMGEPEDEPPSNVHEDLANTIERLKERGVQVSWCTDDA